MQEFETECYATRQRLLESMDRVSAQEAEVKRESTFNTRNLRMQSEAVRHTTEQLEMRELALAGLKEHYERQLADSQQTFRVEWEEAQRARIRNVDDREAKLRDEMALVAQQTAVHQRLLEDVAQARAHADYLNKELGECREAIGSARTENTTLLARVNEMQDYEGKPTPKHTRTPQLHIISSSPTPNVVFVLRMLCCVDLTRVVGRTVELQLRDNVHSKPCCVIN